MRRLFRFFILIESALAVLGSRMCRLTPARVISTLSIAEEDGRVSAPDLAGRDQYSTDGFSYMR